MDYKAQLKNTKTDAASLISVDIKTMQNKGLLFKISDGKRYRNQSVDKWKVAVQIDTYSNAKETTNVGSHLDEFKRLNVFDQYQESKFRLVYQEI